MKKYKSRKTFINIDNPFFIEILKEPKYILYLQRNLFFGLIKWWEFRMVLQSDPKNIFNVVESNY